MEYANTSIVPRSNNDEELITLVDKRESLHESFLNSLVQSLEYRGNFLDDNHA